MFEQFLRNPSFLSNIFETMRDGVMILDAHQHVLFFNRAAEEITGFRREDVVGNPCLFLYHDLCISCEALNRCKIQKDCDLFKEGSVRNRKYVIRSKDGRSVYLLKNAVVLKDSSGEIIGAVETMTDITSLYMKELELEELKHELKKEYWFMGLLGKSTLMQRLYQQIRNAATSEAPVFICGETGTGKNLVAKAIHALSRRKDGPFIEVSCASLNEYLLESELFGHKRGSFTGAISDRKGRFEVADKGTIFLDEIGDMSPLMQAKVLRVLEEKVVERIGDYRPIPVDIRVISASNKVLYKLVGMGKFREDLLYRIDSILIETPPLRERIEDIPILTFHHLKKISIVNNKDIRSISPEAMEILKNYNWTGNVRQLINVLEHAAITCKGDTIEVSDLPGYLFQREKIDKNKNHIEEEKIRSVLSMYKGNRTLTAKHLGISRVTLWKRLKDLGT
ncbi:MAG: sigma 54-interacting transcriptional regulator [Nitrospirota bacterium]